MGIKLKSYTSVEQSRKLANILPIETADAIYPWRELIKDYDSVYILEDMSDIREDDIPCWSLAALLCVLPRIDIEKEIYSDDTYEYRVTAYIGDGYRGDWFDNPIDCCVEMILKLHEQHFL